MQTIPLSQGQSAIVDDDDFPVLSQYRWCYRAERNRAPGYAVRHVKVDGRDRLSYMHRELMNPPDGHEVIFLNYDRLDCRRENLRVVTKEASRRHHRVRSDSKSSILGVRFNPYPRTWTAQTYRGGHYRSIGTFHTQHEAVQAYKEAMLRENPDWVPPDVASHDSPEPVAEASSNPDVDK